MDGKSEIDKNGIVLIKTSTFKPYYIASVFAIVSSLSPAIIVWSAIPVAAFQMTLAVIVVILTYNLKLITNTHLAVIIGVISVLLLQQLVRGGSLFSVQLFVFKFVIIPIVLYYSYLLAQYYNVSFLNTFYPYFFLNIIIVYYRAFFDYTFFGVLSFEGMNQFSDAYSVGKILWRPSNLSSAIVFSVELVIFLALQYFSAVNRKKLMFISILSIVPILVMQSRSSWVILSMLIIYSLMKNRKFVLLSFITLLSSYLFYKLKIISKVYDLLTMNEASFSSRFNSVIESVPLFFKNTLNRIVFGNGTGFANYKMPGNDSFGVYVENFHLSVLFDQGIIIFVFWILFNIYCLLIFALNKTNMSSVLFFVLLTNCFSSSLTVFTLQMFYTLIIVAGFNWTKFKTSHASA